MLKRISSALVGLVLFFAVMFAEKIVLSAAILAVSSIALYEVYRAYQFHKIKVLLFFGVGTAILFSFGNLFSGLHILAFIFIFLLLMVLFLLLKHEQFTSKEVGTYVFVTLVIVYSFSNIVYLRQGENGAFYVWLPFIISWMSDTTAYFTGRFLGRHKLCEKISPKKTVEGAVGGVLGSIAGLFIYQAVLAFAFETAMNPWLLVILGGIGSVLSQMGDLFASVIKRENGIKDFGNIMPGHGGVLDRFDSLLLTMPFVFLFVSLFPLI